MKTLNFNDFDDFGAEPAKDGNFDESGESAVNPQQSHITDFWANAEIDESREIFATKCVRWKMGAEDKMIIKKEPCGLKSLNKNLNNSQYKKRKKCRQVPEKLKFPGQNQHTLPIPINSFVNYLNVAVGEAGLAERLNALALRASTPFRVSWVRISQEIPTPSVNNLNSLAKNNTGNNVGETFWITFTGKSFIKKQRRHCRKGRIATGQTLMSGQETEENHGNVGIGTAGPGDKLDIPNGVYSITTELVADRKVII